MIILVGPSLKAEEERLGIKFPDKGAPILCQMHNGNKIAGFVGFVWKANWGDVSVRMDVDTTHGLFYVYPERGDKWTTEVPGVKDLSVRPHEGNPSA